MDVVGWAARGGVLCVLVSGCLKDQVGLQDGERETERADDMATADDAETAQAESGVDVQEGASAFVPDCPEEVPVQGTSCRPFEHLCEYGECQAPPRLVTACPDGVWEVTSVQCAPPGDCDFSPTSDEALCEEAGARCHLRQCPGSVTVAECVQGRWIYPVVSCPI